MEFSFDFKRRSNHTGMFSLAVGAGIPLAIVASRKALRIEPSFDPVRKSFHLSKIQIRCSKINQKKTYCSKFFFNALDDFASVLRFHNVDIQSKHSKKIDNKLAKRGS